MMTYAGKLTVKEKIIAYLSVERCASLDELSGALKIKKNELKVYLSMLAKEDIISRSWGIANGRKFMKYCLKEKVREAIGI